MSTSNDANTHKITMRVWYVPTSGASSETVDVSIDWSPSVLALDGGTSPNPSPGGGFVSATLGLAAWSNWTVSTSNPESNPLKFEVTLDCLMRALTSVEGSVAITGSSNPTVYTAAVICQNAAT